MQLPRSRAVAVLGVRGRAGLLLLHGLGVTSVVTVTEGGPPRTRSSPSTCSTGCPYSPWSRSTPTSRRVSWSSKSSVPQVELVIRGGQDGLVLLVVQEPRLRLQNTRFSIFNLLLLVFFGGEASPDLLVLVLRDVSARPACTKTRGNCQKSAFHGKLSIQKLTKKPVGPVRVEDEGPGGICTPSSRVPQASSRDSA